MKKNRLFSVLAFLLMLSLSAIGQTVNGIIYDLENAGTAWVIGVSGASGNVTIPSYVSYNSKSYRVIGIGSQAFRNVSGITSVTIPSTVTTIGFSAFSGCSLTSVNIPSSVTEIPSRAFEKCVNLKTINIPSSVKTIRNCAFSSCSSLVSVVLPSSITSIEQRAFEGCTSLTSVDIPSGVTSIEMGTFYRCTSLSSVNIPSSVTVIVNLAFSGCTSLESVTIPEGVTYIGYGAFLGCSGLTSIIVESGNTVYDSRDNCNAIIETASNALIQGCNNTVIPSSVTSIGSYAFNNCSGLTSVTIPESVTSIGDWAFSYSGLTSVTIPSSITSISSYAFSNCTGLTSVIIQEGVTSIGSSAFSGCTGLASVTIPSSVTSISERAFESCNGLTAVHISDIAAWCGIQFGDRIANPLLYAEHLYLNGEEVKDLVIPEGVTSIGDYSFYGFTGMTSVTIPSSVTNFGALAFFGCTGLTRVISMIQEPFETTSLIFAYYEGIYSYDCVSATLFVPKGTKAKYEATVPWKYFNPIIELGDVPTGVESASYKDGAATVTERYTIDGKRIGAGQRGLNIVRMSDGTVRKVVVK